MNSRRNGSGTAHPRTAIRPDDQRVAQAFGLALRCARERRTLSLDLLAERGGFDCGYPSLLERGLQEPTLCDFFRLSMALGIAPERLLEDTIVACVGSRLGRTDLIRLREIWLAFAGTLSQCRQGGWLPTSVLGSLLLDELARHGLTIVALPIEPREGHGHA
jgi:transcriptional regulator with XRE-family HTH domain